jgi:hypothetical protein
MRYFFAFLFARDSAQSLYVCLYVWAEYIRIKQNQPIGYSFMRAFIQLNQPGFCSKFPLD